MHLELAHATLVAEERRVGNYIAFNGEGKGIRPLAGVNNLRRSKLFYDAALAPLGLIPHLQIPGEGAYRSLARASRSS